MILAARFLSRVRFSTKNLPLGQVLNGTSVTYLESLYEEYLQGKSDRLSPSLQAFFKGLEQGVPDDRLWEDPRKATPGASSATQGGPTPNLLKVKMLVDAYRTYGHNYADLDPLRLDHSLHQQGIPKEKSDLRLEAFGLSSKDLHMKFPTAGLSLQTKKAELSLGQILEEMKHVYCEQVSFEYMHITSKAERDYIASKIEHIEEFTPSKESLIESYHSVSKDWAFASFLQEKFNSSKRFGVEGCESVICGLGKLVQTAAKLGASSVVMGMAHRGRLSTLYNIFDKPAAAIFQEFLDKKLTNNQDGTGDVKYHMGLTIEKEVGGKKIKLSMLPNPSHLEAVNPLVYGRARAYQEQLQIGEEERKRQVVPVLIHGDAAVAGQGVVYQSLQMHDLHDYSVGGVIHIVVNNQIGFTTPPSQSRSTVYCTEIGKVVGAPIIHVNGDRPELVDRCIEFAVEYRQKYGKDIFIDVVGFRKFGHNEQDQPAFTQPIMYSKIQGKKNVWQISLDRLLESGALTKEEALLIFDRYKADLKQAYDSVQAAKRAQTPDHGIPQFKAGFLDSKRWGPLERTGVGKEDLKNLIQVLTDIPAGFNTHPTIKKIYLERKAAFDNNDVLDWPTMESLAFASLAAQGYGVRLSGQDVERGTFSHRHALLSDQTRDVEKLMPLGRLSKQIRICNSLLSEFGVMGFQYGYSITAPNALVMWEAQFGDFANTAQVIIDNFIISGESKWGLSSALTLLMPHGMDGQGPEHSSARIERFLQLSRDDPEEFYSLSREERERKVNLQVLYCTQSSNYFHALRRQMRRNFRKPLVVFNSKKLLRFKKAGSKTELIEEGTSFREVLDEENPAADKVSRVLFCSGQFYFDVAAFLEEAGRKDTAVVRIEQMSPFPYAEVEAVLKKYGGAKEVAWVQEEHYNQGCSHFARRRIEFLLQRLGRGLQCGYYGRKVSSSSACGSTKKHKEEEQEVRAKLLK